MRLTPTQKIAIMRLLEMPEGEWRFFGSGSGKYRVALRALTLRAPGMIEIENNGCFNKFRLTKAGRFILCPGDHGESCCGAFALCEARK